MIDSTIFLAGLVTGLCIAVVIIKPWEGKVGDFFMRMFDK